MMALSLRARLTLWYTCALVVALCLFGADVLWILSGIGTRRVDRELESLMATLDNVVRDELTEDPHAESAAEDALRTLTEGRHAIAILDGHGETLAARWNGLEPGSWSRLAQSARGVWTEETRSGGWRIHARAQTFTSGAMTLLVGSPLADVQRERHEALEAMLVGFPIVLLIAGAGGFWLASLGLRPITDMSRQAARISLTGMENLGPAGRTDELGQFARAFNGLVARLRSALQTQRQFMADASHELRTPVAVVRTAVDVALSRDHRSEGEYREALATVGDQSRRLGRLVDGMLVLARADAGGYPLRPVDLYLDEVVEECRRAVDVLAAERGVTICVGETAETPFRGDEDLLRQLIVNVLQNAVQHTPPGGAVSVAISRAAGVHDGAGPAVIIRVTDTGPGIAAADHTRIFDRFVQLDSARHGRGAGLGLPIARWIAEAHDGTLVLESSGPGGSTFCIALGASSIPGPLDT
jgi:signal transduction histidine kinase